jgi:hypothetical protein
VQKGFKGDRARKINQFGTMFHILQHGRPMLEYEHWSDNFGWLIAKYLYRQVMMKVVEVLAAARYVAITCDEVTTMDNQSWISIYAYVVEDFYRKPILVSLEQLTDGASAARPTMTILDAMTTHGGLTMEDVRQKLISFGANGAVVF